MGLAAVTVAIATASTFASASFVVDQPASAAQEKKMAACKLEYSSLRDMCASEAGWGQPVMRESLTPQQAQTIGQEQSRYRMAIAACDGLLGNNRPICVSRAGVSSTLTGLN